MSNRHHPLRWGLILGALALAAVSCSEEPESISYDLDGADAVTLACVEGMQGYPVAHCAQGDSRGSLYAFVLSAADGNLAILRLTGRDAAGNVTTRPGLEDASRSVPMITPLRVGDAPVRVRLAPDGRHLFTLNNGTRDITVVRVGDRCVVGRLSWAELPEAIPPAMDLLPGLAWSLAAGDPAASAEVAHELLFSLPGAGALGRFDLDACALSDDAPCVPPGAEVPVADCAAELAFGGPLAPLANGLRPSPGWLAWSPRAAADDGGQETPEATEDGYALLVADARFDQVYSLSPATGDRLQDPLAVSPQCGNGLDDDADGLVDLEDPGCSWGGDGNEESVTSPPQCANGLDDDGDRLVDLDDPGCSSAGDATEDGPYPVPECADGLDNDGDELVDLEDPGCEAGWDGDERVPAVKLGPCYDGVDNDGDGLLDRFDPDCVAPDGAPPTPLAPRTEALCANGLDDDADGRVDGDDPGCAAFDDQDEAGGDDAVCSNGIDDDGDELVDLDDPGCAGAGDGDEDDPEEPAACANGLDDDGDGLADYPDDPGCLGPGWGEEREPARLPRCSNGIDDDGDGATDYPDDADCPYAGATSELAVPGSCENGLDDDGDELVDAADPDCRFGDPAEEDGEQLRLAAGCASPGSQGAPWAETSCARGADGALATAPLSPRELPRCANSRDDDGDGLVDAEDPGCAGPLDQDEVESTEAAPCLDWSKDAAVCVYAGASQDAPGGPAACEDGLDNDGDGLVDADDPGCFAALLAPDGLVADSEWDGRLISACADGVPNPVPEHLAGRYEAPPGAWDATSPGCFDERDAVEAARRPEPDCSNGLDDDGDGHIDGADPGCFGPGDDDEDDGTVLPSCGDGLDNDGDGLIDADDPQCTSSGGVEGGWRAAGLAGLFPTPDGRFLYILHRWQQAVVIVNAQTGAVLDTQADVPFSSGLGISLGASPTDLAWACGRPADAEAGADGAEPSETTASPARPEPCRPDSPDVLAYVTRADGQISALQVKRRGVDVHGLADLDSDTRDRIGTVTLHAPDGSALATADAPPAWAPRFSSSPASRGGPGDYGISLTSLLGPDNDHGLTVGPGTLGNYTWYAVWEGVVPYSERTTGTFEAGASGWLRDSEQDFCRLGVVPGDRVLVLSTSTSGDDRCALLFGARARNGREGFEYCVREVEAHGLALQAVPLDGTPATFDTPCPEVDARRRIVDPASVGADSFEDIGLPNLVVASKRALDPLPTGNDVDAQDASGWSCFPEQIRYRIRASGQFLVYRRTGSGALRFPHNQTSRYGKCELVRYPNALRSARAWPGRPFRNEALGFTLASAPEPRLVATVFPDQAYSGHVDPRTHRLPRGTQWRIETRSGLNPARWSTGGLPVAVAVDPLRGRVIVSDSAFERVWELAPESGSLALAAD